MLSRRAIIAGAVAALAAPPVFARAQTSADGGQTAPTILRLQRRDIEVNGRTASVYGIRQPNGAFGLTTEVGKPFRVRVENAIDEPSLIHWHGLAPPWRQDGVPGISAPPIPPGGSADYDFPLRFGGTFWMHSHQGLQEQLMMSAPLIIHDERDRPDEQEVVVMLADFSFTPPEQIFENLKASVSMASMAKPAARGSGSMSAMSGMKKAGMAKSKGAAAPDLNDVKYDAFLANDHTLADPEIVKVEPGDDQVRVSAERTGQSPRRYPRPGFPLPFTRPAAANQCGRRRSSQPSVRSRSRRSGGMSSARRISPSGSIQRPKNGRIARQPPMINSTPTGMRAQREAGLLSQRVIACSRPGSRRRSLLSRRSGSVRVMSSE